MKKLHSNEFPLFSLFILALINWYGLGLFLLFRSELPEFLSYYKPTLTGTVVLLLVSLAHACFIAGMTFVLLRLNRVLAWLFLFLSQAWLPCEVIFYVKFHRYPSFSLFLDLVNNPLVFLQYSASGLSIVDWSVFFAYAALLVLLSSYLLRKISISRQSGFKATPFFLLAVFFTLSANGFFTVMPGYFHSLLRGHSLSLARFYIPSRINQADNSFELVVPYYPQRISAEDSQDNLNSIPMVKHVLLIMLESVRARNLPQYGYQRNTVPQIYAAKDDWIVMQRCYSPGPSTSNSFPVIFRSQYSAGSSFDYESSPNFAHYLTKNGIKSAYLSAGAMDWKKLKKRLGTSEFTLFYDASNTDERVRESINKSGTFFRVDDGLIVDRYQEHLQELKGQPLVSVLHFVGTHVPYRHDPNLPPFKPHANAGSSNVTHNRIYKRNENAYDKSIRTVDTHIARALKILEQADLLEESVVIIASDHGEAFGEHSMRFHGQALYEEQTHIPCLVRVGKSLAPLDEQIAQHTQHPKSLIDVAPTLLNLFKIKQPEQFEGWSWLQSPQKPYELLFHKEVGESIVVLQGKNKYLFDIPLQRALEFNLEKDPLEKHNLWPQRSDTLRTFLQTLEERKVISPKASL